ncbi:MAG: nucleotidyltransferase domain-containing protein [Desulfamplus sp.]|nr:nucleotidyltransferase domain-containing protein [Desulfamplus sp.]
MDRNEIIRILCQYKKEFKKQYGINKMGFFGSFAKNNINKHSDIDIFVDVEKPDIFLIAGIKNDLEERLNISVDVVAYNNYMNSFLKKSIDSDGLYV